MLHVYAIVLAVILLVGALAAIIICVCVDIVPIIKSRGSTLVSRDSVTQEQTRMLKKRLRLKKFSASVDLIDTVHGRKINQARIKSERPRFGSTPLSLLTGSGDKTSDMGITTTTVIMEALPKKSPLAESNNNNNDVTKVERDVTNSDVPPSDGNFNNRPENVYIETKANFVARRSKSEGSPSVNGRRTKSADLLEEENATDVRRGAMTYNPRVTRENEIQTQIHEGSPNVRNSRSMQDQPMNSSREQISDSEQNTDAPPSQPAVRSKLYSQYGNSPSNSRDFSQDERGIPVHNIEEKVNNQGEILTQSCDSGYCKWCQIERDRNLKERARERQLPFRRTESFPENYHANSSPRISQKHLHRQLSFEEDEAAKMARGFPYDRNKFCKTPHRGYSPCPDCFHQPYFYTYQGDRSSPTFVQTNPGMCNPPKNPGIPLPGQLTTLLSSSSSSSSSGSSSRFRHLRQPLEDIQEDTSDCYAIRDVTSTIDSRELSSSPDDDTMPKSATNSSMSASPPVLTQTQPALVSVSGS